jgi:hypothetical protein
VRPEGLGKFKNSPHRESNPRPSGLWHSSLTTTLLRAACCSVRSLCAHVKGKSSDGDKSRMLQDSKLNCNLKQIITFLIQGSDRI